MHPRRNYPRMLSSPSQAEGNDYPPGKSLRVFTKIYLPLLRNRGWGGANGGSAKPTIGYVIGSVKRFCCYKSEKLLNSFSIFVYIFGFVVKIYHYHKFILSFLEVVVRRCSVKKSLFFNKVAGLAQVFSCEFCEIFRNTIFYRTPLVADSVLFINFRISLSLARYKFKNIFKHKYN